MDGRFTYGMFVACVLLASGCVTTSTPSNVVAPTTTMEEPTNFLGRKEGMRKESTVKLLLALGVMREQQAHDLTDKHEAQKTVLDQARQAYLDALKLDNQSLEAQRGLARVYVQMNQYDQAFATYKKALARYPNDASLWYDQGMCHNRRKDWNEAIRCFQKSHELDPENHEIHTTLGLTLARAGQIDQSLFVLTKASGSAMAHVMVARMQIHTGHPSEARVQLQLALRDNPNLEDARELLTSLDAGNVAQASANR